MFRMMRWCAVLVIAAAVWGQTPTTLRGAAEARPLLIGAAADGADVNPDPLTAEPLYKQTLAAQFNMLEAENAMKWSGLHPNPPGSANGGYDFTVADELVNFALSHAMTVRGHTLLWHSSNPNWLSNGGYTSAQLFQILHDHITTVVTRYRGRVFAWDVVNEALDESGGLRDSIWYNQPGIGLQPGTGYIEQAFRWAHEADPDALLFYNEYNIEDQYCSGGQSAGPNSAKFQGMYNMLADFVARGVPVHGAGFQMHIDTSGCPTSAVLADHFQKLAALGLQVHITEMDVKIPDTSTASLQAQAQTYQRILNVCLANPACTVFQTWGFTDKHTWLPNNMPLPWDVNYQPKPAVSAMLNAMVTAPPVTGCTYSLDHTAIHVSGAGGAAPVEVTTWPACSWTVTGLPDWISGAASRKGSGDPELMAAANPGGARSATITVAGTPVTVTQDSTCSTALDRTLAVFPLAGGSVTVNVIASSGCSWSATSTLGWVTFTGATSGTGNGSVTVQATGASAPRSGNVTIAGISFTVSEGGLQFVPVTPCRVADTRFGTGSFGGPTPAGGTARSFPIPQGGCNIPSTALAYSLNVTAVPQGVLSYLTLWPTGQSQPGVSTLNSFQGQVVANAAIVPAGSNGEVSAFVTDRSDVIIDINGYFATPSSGSFAFYPLAPCRIADTRFGAGPFAGPVMGKDESRDFPIPSSACGVPSGQSAYSLNVTVVPQAPSLGFLTLFQAGNSRPGVSTLNSWAGKVVANAAIVPAGSGGAVSVFVTDPTHVILDVNGYFGTPGSSGALSFYPVAPCRVADTRNPAGPFGGPTLEAGTARSFTIPSSACGIPSSAAAYSMNVTVVPGGILPYLTAWPTGSAQPGVSTLNSWDGTVVANAAIVPAGTDGAISVFAAGRTDVILDINGYFAP